MRISFFDQSSPVHPVSEYWWGSLSVTYTAAAAVIVAGLYFPFLIEDYSIFTESAPTPIQSISGDICLLSVCCRSVGLRVETPLQVTGDM